MWGVWNSSQVLILTFEFSSRWPHHLMPLNCFSASRFLHSYPSLPPVLLLLLYRSLFFLSFPYRIPSSASVPHVSPLFYISLLAHFPVFVPPSLSPLRPLSQVSDRPISAPMIAVGVLAWQLSQQWQEPGSAWELILPLLLLLLPPWWETERETERERNDCYHPFT